MSTINVNSVTQTIASFKNNQTKQTSEKNIKDIMLEKQINSESVTKTLTTSGVRQKSIKDMTMEEYKVYISEKISQIPSHPSHILESRAINITEKGFEAMKNDPEYEKWVLDYLKADFAVNNPWTNICGGGYVVYNFGAKKEEFNAQGWYPGYQNGNGEKLFNEKSKNSFWENKVERKKQIQKNYDKKQQQKEILAKQEEMKRLQEAIYEKAIFGNTKIHQQLGTQYDLGGQIEAILDSIPLIDPSSASTNI